MALKKKSTKAIAPAKRVPGKPASAVANKSGKGCLNFWYSFTGAISKELYTGAVTLLTIKSLVLGVALNITLALLPATASMGVVNAVLYTFGTLQILIVLSMVAIAYKRSHALGISGFYSIIGSSLFSPYFKFFKSPADMPQDGVYRSAYPRLKKLGAFITRNSINMISYLVIVSVATILLGMDADKASIDSAAKLLVWLTAFNIIQVLSVDMRLVKRFYTPVVKVLSFAAYTLVVVEITRIYTAYQFFQALISSVQAGAI